MFIRILIVILCLGCMANPSQTDEPSKSKPIDPKTIAAYEKIGAQHGGFAVDADGSVRFTWIKEEAAHLLPGFRFLALRDGVLAKMPPIEVPFGLDLHLPRASNAHLKELKGIKNLTTLDLQFTKVTDAGLKELKDLQDLAVLDLRGTRVTDAGLKELKNLKNLKWLNLSGTSVTAAGRNELKELKSLVVVYLGNTSITAVEVQVLRDLHLTTLRVEALADSLPLDTTGPTIAAGPVPDSEFKPLFEQDMKNILGRLEEKPMKKTADRAVKSSALMIAAYAQSRLGKNPADDGKLIALRDAAIKIASTPKKQLAAALPIAKGLSLNMAPAGKGGKVDILKDTGVDLEELMYQFKKTSIGGLGIEEEIKAQAKKVTVKPEVAAAIAIRSLFVADFVDNMQPTAGFSAAKLKKNWGIYNKNMKTAATELAAAAKSGDAKAIGAAFLKLDGSCVQCHNKFK